MGSYPWGCSTVLWCSRFHWGFIPLWEDIDFPPLVAPGGLLALVGAKGWDGGPGGLTLPSLPRLHTAGDAARWWLCAPLLLPSASGFPLPQEEVGPVLSPALPWGTQYHLPKLWQLPPAAHRVPRGAVPHAVGMRRWVVVGMG